MEVVGVVTVEVVVVKVVVVVEESDMDCEEDNGVLVGVEDTQGEL